MSEVVYRESADRPWLERLGHTPVRYAAGVAGLAGLYYAGAKTGYLLEFSGLPFGSALGQTCGNVLEVVIATLLLRRLVRHGSPLASVRGVGMMAVSIAAGAAVSATIGATSLLSGSVIGFDRLPTVWRTWWLGDASGALRSEERRVGKECRSR